MNILAIENLAKSYGIKILFENLSLGVADTDKIGLIGVNGTGKTTLLKIIAGVEQADQGKITLGNLIKIEYLSQNPVFNEQATVLEQIFKGNSAVMQLLRAYETTLEQLNKNPTDPTLQAQLMVLSQQMDAEGAWQIESEAKAVLTRLGIADFEAKVGSLSGGQRKRIALAGALINPTDLLILDEPTNHIDNDTVDWLEQYLSKYRGALLMITHDRYFLDRVVNRIIELDQGTLYSYTGNYSNYLEIKAEREDQLQASENKRQNLLRNELAWMRRGAKARTTKQKARIDRFESLSAEKPLVGNGKVDIAVGSSRLGKQVIEIEHLRKAFAGQLVIEDFSYILLRDDRLGIIGPNGSGKSTLLNLIIGTIQPDDGNITIGQTVKIGYFSQESSEMDDSLRVIEYIKAEAEVITTADGVTISAAQMLERFLFPPHVQWTLIANLSGGEKRRLFLLRILMGAPNVLLLDEPTNDLDIQTLTILEDYLDDFPGAVLAVSHDRYFLDRIAEKILAFNDQGKIAHYTGNYSDYRVFLDTKKLTEANSSEGVKKVQAQDQQKVDGQQAQKADESKNRQLKFSYKEQKEYEQIEDDIARVENELQEVSAQLNAAGSNYELLQKLTVIQQKLEQQLEAAMDRWAYLTELAEKIADSKTK